MGEVNFNDVLTQVLSISDKNLDMQADFLKHLYDIKSKFETFEKDTTELRKDLDITLTNSFNIVNLMKSRSNETISAQVEVVQSTLSTFFSTLEKMLAQLEAIKITKQEEDKLKLSVTELEKDYKEIAVFYKMVNKWLIILGLGLLIFQMFFGVLRWREDSKLSQFETQIQKLVDSQKKRQP